MIGRGGWRRGCGRGGLEGSGSAYLLIRCATCSTTEFCSWCSAGRGRFCSVGANKRGSCVGEVQDDDDDRLRGMSFEPDQWLKNEVIDQTGWRGRSTIQCTVGNVLLGKRTNGLIPTPMLFSPSFSRVLRSYNIVTACFQFLLLQLTTRNLRLPN